MESIRAKSAFLCDMDGVIYHGNQILPGAGKFVEWLQRNNKKFLFLTNSSERSPMELSQKLQRMGLNVSQEHFYTSALATASFISNQSPGCSVYAIGAPGLLNALHDAGIAINDVNPDYVVVGETNNYNYEGILKAAKYVWNGAKLIGTNPDLTGPSENGIIPATRALLSPIELATGKAAYYVGKPNPLMMRTGLKLLESRRIETVIVGDRMDTDIIAGIESEIDTVLVLTGVSDKLTPGMFPYRPKHILNSVGEIADE